MSETAPGGAGEIDFLLKAVGLGFALPAGISALILLVAHRLANRLRFGGGTRWWGLPVALGAGYAVGQVAIIGWPAVPPQETMHWLLFFSLFAMAAGVLEAIWGPPHAVAWGLRLVLSALLTWLLLRPLLQPEAVDGVGWLTLAAIVVGGLLFWSLLEELAKRVGGRTLLATLLVVCGAGSAALALGGLVHAQLCGALAGALLGALCVAFFLPDVSMARGGVPVAALVLLGLGIDGHYYSELPTPSALLVGLAPMSLWLGQLGPMRRMKGWQAGLICAIGVLVPLVIALAIASGLGASGPDASPEIMSLSAPTHVAATWLPASV